MIRKEFSTNHTNSILRTCNFIKRNYISPKERHLTEENRRHLYIGLQFQYSNNEHLQKETVQKYRKKLHYEILYCT